MANHLTRIIQLEQRLQARSLDRGTPDPSRLTEAEADRLRRLSEKAGRLGGLGYLTNAEIDEGAALSCRLWGRDPDDPYGYRQTTWPRWTGNIDR